MTKELAKRRTIRATETGWRRLKVVAEKQGITRSKMITNWIDDQTSKGS